MEAGNTMVVEVRGEARPSSIYDLNSVSVSWRFTHFECWLLHPVDPVPNPRAVYLGYI
jgi:hypothetical protein